VIRSVGSPDIPQRLHAALERLQVAAAPEQEQALLRYLALLQRWNAVYNLTAVREPDAMLTHHLLDCLAAVGPLGRELGRHKARRIVDVGSGAGLPGVVFGLMDAKSDVLCVDSVAKKVAFISQAIGELGLKNVRAQHARIQSVHARADVVTARAYASLNDLVRNTAHLLDAAGVWMAMKGRRPDQEMADLPSDIEVFHVEPVEVPGLRADRCLVWLRRVKAA